MSRENLENGGLLRGDKRVQFIHYSLVRDNLVNTLNRYVQEACPVSKPLKRERKARAVAGPPIMVCRGCDPIRWGS